MGILWGSSVSQSIHNCAPVKNVSSITNRSLLRLPWSAHSFRATGSYSFGMNHLADYPFVVLAVSLTALWGSAQLGVLLHKKLRPMEESERDDFNVVSAATMTLLGLIIGFSFAMAISRYDQRKNYEEDEANAIGTAYFRAGVLPAEEAITIRKLLENYLEQRILFYETRRVSELGEINSRTAELQTQLWLAIQSAAKKQPTPIVSLTVASINDVLNSQGYTQAAWWNRLPAAAWWLLLALAMFCNLLIGYGSRRRSPAFFLVLPVAVSISLFLISDISSPRRGLIRVVPQNLISLADSLRAQETLLAAPANQ
jgi:hypothetical protein